MSVSREDIIRALKQERDEAQRIIDRCNLALAAFQGVAEDSVAVVDPGPEPNNDRVVAPTAGRKTPKGVSLDNLNRAKARVKRIDQPFGRKDLAKAMGVADSTAGLAIKALAEEGWVEVAEARPPVKGGDLYRYVPAKPDPKEHPRHDHPRETNLNGGRGEAVAGTGQKLRSTNHDINAIIRRLGDDDWTITRSGSDHFIARKGSRQVRFSGSPPGQQAITRIKSDLRAAGARV